MIGGYDLQNGVMIWLCSGDSDRSRLTGVMFRALFGFVRPIDDLFEFFVWKRRHVQLLFGARLETTQDYTFSYTIRVQPPAARIVQYLKAVRFQLSLL